MKQAFTNIFSLLLCNICVVMLLSTASVQLQAQTLTRDGIVEDEYKWLLGNDLPSDFNEAVFDASGNPTMHLLMIITELTNLPDYYIEMGYGPGKYMILATTTGTAYSLIPYAQPMTTFCYSNALAGGRVYLTGTYDEASAGVGNETEGFLYFKGGKGETLDLYLHDFNIKTKSKLLDGQSMNQWLRGYILGNSSPIAIGSTSDDTNAPYQVNFHIRGENRLVGGATSKVGDTGDPFANILADVLYISSASIAVRPIPDVPAEDADKEVVLTGLERYRNIATKLVFDDVWPISATDPTATMHTNGVLDLPVEGDLGAPSVDLGNSKGQVEFNGGRYKFHTPRTNSMFYVSSMAICYRQTTLKGFTTIGVGSSMSTGTASEETGTKGFRDVVFNDGTFSTYPAEKKVTTTNPKDTTKVDVVQRGWYVHNTDLRVPYNARIYGGTFTNCDVYRCDGSGEQGVPPLYIDPLNPAIEKPQCRIKKEIDPAAIQNGVYVGDALESGYGSASLTPVKEADDKYYVYPYLVEGCDPTPPVYSRNWVTLIPKMGYEGLLTMGGDQMVYSKTVDKTKDLTNKYLFYARLNEYTKKYAAVMLAGFEVEVGLAINMIVNDARNPELEFAQVTNTGTYTIDQGLYTMLSFPSNEWQLISFPYDVHRVWVMETTKDQCGQNDTIGPNETVDEFLVRQGKADGKLAQNIVTSLCPDIFSGKGSGVNMNLIDIATEQINCPPFQLTHYNGKNGAASNAAQAHYYLYEQIYPDDTDPNNPMQDVASGWGIWNIGGGDDLSANWKAVEPIASTTPYYDEGGNEIKDAQVLMKAGAIYNLFLPSGKDRYWDGKYLIFEGFGPQTIQGTDNHASYADESFDYGKQFIFQGNRTFANFMYDTEMAGDIFLPVREGGGDQAYHYTFKPYDNSVKKTVWIHPCEVYGVTQEAGIESISMRGVITRKNDVVTGNTPVVGDVLLYAYSQAGGLLIDSRADQYVQVVGIDGRTLFAGQLHDGEQKRIPATTGVYIVRTDNQAIKLLVER